MSTEALITEIEIPMPWGHIAAKTYGKVIGRPVLAIHDWLDNAGTFDKLAHLLVDSDVSFFIVAIDLPGHGKSSHLPQGIAYHLLDMVPVLNRIIMYFKWKRVSILGHGIGAGLALLYSTVYSGSNQDNLAKLVLLNSIKPPTVDDEGGAPVIAAAIEELLNFDQNKLDILAGSYEDCVASHLSEKARCTNEQIAKALMIRGARQDSEGNWCLTRDPRLKFRDTLRITHEQCFNLLHHMKTPALAITTPDILDSPSNNNVQKAKSIYQGSGKSFSTVEVEGNHYIHLTEPDIIVKTISEFLTEHSFRDYL